MNEYTNIDEYIANFPNDTQTILEKIRGMAREYMPSGATEAIRYGIPTIQVAGKNVFHFAAYPTHIGVYPATDMIVERYPTLAKYRSGKGTFKFLLNDEIPYNLIELIIREKL